MAIQPLVALDVGSTKIACAIGLPHQQAAGFELLGSSLVPYPAPLEGWLSDPLLVGRTIEQALAATAVRADVSRALVAINPPALISEQVRSMVRLADEPVIVRAHDLQRLQERALDQALAVDRDVLLMERLSTSGNGFDHLRDPRGVTATRLMGQFHLVSMPMAARRRLVQAVESAGLEVARLSWTLPAALAASADALGSAQRVLIIDVGGWSTTVGVFVDGVLSASARVEEGGGPLAMAIATQLQTTMDHATAWSLEATLSRKPEVRALIDASWARLKPAIAGLLAEGPRPDAVLVTGRGALLDGFVEWVEQATGMTATISRSARTQRLTDLARQVALAPAIGVLEQATRAFTNGVPRPSHRFVDRLISRTRTILTEYF